MRKLPYKTTQWKVSLPTAIAGRVEQRLSNITGTGPAYATRSRLIAHLLQGWLDIDADAASYVLDQAVKNAETAAHPQDHQGVPSNG